MGLARSFFLKASRSQWLARQLRDRRFVRRAVRRFLPGEDLASALAAAKAFAEDGIGSLLTELGEQVTNPAEARAVRDHYLDVLGQIQRQRLPAEISVKVTHLGLDIDREQCVAHLHALARRAGESGSWLWIDMEESRYVDATLEIFRRVRSEHRRVGVALQAYLRRTPGDLDSLLPLDPAVRLVKGAYNEPPEVALPVKRDVDEQYFTLASKLLEQVSRSVRPVFGTHDMPLVARIQARAEALRLKKSQYEFHMLYGIRSSDQKALAKKGHTVKVLISYGSAWFAWYMRRLAERPANVWFVLRNIV